MGMQLKCNVFRVYILLGLALHGYSIGMTGTATVTKLTVPNEGGLTQESLTQVTSCAELDMLVDVNVTIQARIRPWTFNITSYQNKEGLTSENLVYTPVPGSEDYSDQVRNINMTVYTGQLLKLHLEALVTDHAIFIFEYPILQSEVVLYSDLFGNKIDDYRIPQAAHNVETVIYLQLPVTTQILKYMTNAFLSGAGGFGMFGYIHIIERQAGNLPVPVDVVSGLNCNMVGLPLAPNFGLTDQIFVLSLITFVLIIVYALKRKK